MFSALQKRNLGLGRGPLGFQQEAASSLDLVQRLDRKLVLQGHTGCVNTVGFSDEGHLVVSGSDDKRIMLWNWHTGVRTLSYKSGHHNNIFQAKFLPNSNNSTIVSCAADGQVRIGHLRGEGGKVQTSLLATHGNRAHKLALEPGAPACFYSCGEDGRVFHYDMRCPTARQSLLVCTKGSVQAATLARNERLPQRLQLHSIHCNPLRPWQFAVGGSDIYVRVYDQRRSLSAATGHSSDLTTPAAAVADPVRKLAPKGIRRQTQQFRRGEMTCHVTCANFSRQGEILATYNDENIYLFASEGPALPAASPAPLQESSGLRKRFRKRAQSPDASHDLRRTQATRSSGTRDSLSGRGNSIPQSSAEQLQLQQQAVNGSISMHAAAAPQEHGRQLSIPVQQPVTPNAAAARQASARSLTVAPSSRDGGAHGQPESQAAGSRGESPPPSTSGGATATHAATAQPSLAGAVRSAADAQGQIFPMTGSLGRQRGPETDCSLQQPRNEFPGQRAAVEFEMFSEGETASRQRHHETDQSPAVEKEEAGISEAHFRSDQERRASNLDNTSIAATSSGQSISSSGLSSDADDANDTEMDTSESESEEDVEFMLGPPELDELSNSEDSADDTNPVGGVVMSSADREAFLNGQQDDFAGLEDEVLMTYSGHRNCRTVKGVSFLGESDEYVMSGSDDGHIYIWSKADGRLRQWLLGDAHVVNCLEPHPVQPMSFATSGIDDDVKLWTPTASEPHPVPDTAARIIERNRMDQGPNRVPTSSARRILLRLQHLAQAREDA